MREKYLLKIKNAMLWHFRPAEIRTTLTDINAYFESALQEGLSEEEIIRQYGNPQTVVQELQKEMGIPERKHPNTMPAKWGLLAFCALAFLLSWRFCSFQLAANLSVVWTSIFLWFCTGNDCILGILSMTTAHKHFFWKCQSILFLFYLILQNGAFFFQSIVIQNSIPYSASLGNGIRISIYVILAVLILAAIYFLKGMLQGNIYLFFTLIQTISLILGVLSYYYDFLRRFDTLPVPPYLITEYLVGIAVSLLLLPYILKHQSIQEKRGIAE